MVSMTFRHVMATIHRVATPTSTFLFRKQADTLSRSSGVGSDRTDYDSPAADPAEKLSDFQLGQPTTSFNTAPHAQ